MDGCRDDRHFALTGDHDEAVGGGVQLRTLPLTVSGALREDDEAEPAVLTDALRELHGVAVRRAPFDREPAERLEEPADIAAAVGDSLETDKETDVVATTVSVVTSSSTVTSYCSGEERT